jgi:hypothetical protein
VALSSSELTKKLWAVYGVDGPPTDIIKALAEGVVEMVKDGTVSGMVIGTGPSGSMAPQNLNIIATIMGAKISALVPMTIYSKVYPLVEAEITKAKPPPKMKVKAIADAKKRVKSESDLISSHIMGKALINFLKVDGKCTQYWQQPPPAGTGPMPGTLVAGGAKNGKMMGLNGTELAELVAVAHQVEKVPGEPAIGATDKMKKMYNEMVDYIMSNIEIEFPTGTVQGSFPPPPAPVVPMPILGGMAMGGKVK